MTTYIDLLLDVAQGTRLEVPPPPAGALGDDPATFLLNLFYRLGQTSTLTRDGVEAMMEAVFEVGALDPTGPRVAKVEALRTTLANATDIQAHFALTYLPHTSATYGAFWEHVIVPEWNQHAEAYRIACATAAR